MESAKEKWRGIPSNQIRLSEILRDPVFLAALELVESEVGVREGHLTGSLPLSPEGITRLAAIEVGVKSVFPSLQNLLKVNKSKAHPDAGLQDFDHYTSENRP